MQDLTALLFDKDGTLIDFNRTWGRAAGAVIRAVAGGSAEAEHRLAAVSHYLPDESRFLPTSPLVSGSSAHYGPLWAEAVGQPATAAFLARIDQLFAEAGLLHLTPIGRPQAALARLKAAGLDLGIVTNDAEASAHRQAEALGLSHLLTAVHGYDSGFGSKPSPGMVRAFAERFGHRPGQVAVIGDSAHDFAAARGAGARFILVRSGPMPVEHLLSEADLVIDTVDELPDRLLGPGDAASFPGRENAV
ncbi:HAD family hydrolase [Xanthobacter dioxanivorans]|uniref:phosphoglycolate phosphatase n=1 Tax=Xanthobacter dioxanivorans TaxID=2528964 RepID=A0A974PSK8_9HYPH|nr:HAD family hydrolase [Xanthobacter dioxanivorans]QRG08508.1 HAD family hydrolase [Xanthobacter dioxanivorans]